MRRDMAFFLGLLLAFAPMGVRALGLGEVRVESALNEELDAELALVSASEAELDTLKVTVASRDAFDRYGLDRPVEVANLEFEVRQRADGTHYVHVTSPGLIREPFLTFLVEAKWASGRLLREYTVLLDPPVYADKRDERPTEKPTVADQPEAGGDAGQPADAAPAEPAPAEQERRVAAESEPPEQAAEPEVTTQPLTRTERAGDAQPAEERETGDGTYGPIQRNETLWSIASRLRPEGVSVNQMMLALYRANPDAFGGNINHLKRGRILRIPERGDMTSIARGQATSEVRQQNRQWQERTGQGGEQRSAVADAGEAEERDRLRIVAPEEQGSGGEAEGEGAGTGGDAEAVAQLREELADARERAEEAETTNNELQDHIANLEKQLDDAERLLSVQDDELAALQQSRDETGTGSETTAPEEEPADAAEADDAGTAEPALDEPVVADQDTTGQETTGQETTEQPAPEETQAGGETVAETETGEAATGEAATEPGKETATEPGATEPGKEAATEPGKDEQVPAEEATVAESGESGDKAAGDATDQADRSDSDRARPVVTTTTREPSLVESLLEPLTNPLIGGGLAVLLLIAVVGLILVRRKRREKKGDSASGEIFAGGDWDEESVGESEPMIGETDTAEEFSPGDTSSMPAGPGGEAAEETDEFGETAVMERPVETAKSGSSEVDESDPVSEADFHMAYGLYDEAAERLEKGIDENPGRRDLKTKLLEVHFAAGNRDDFVKAARQLREEMGEAPDDDWSNVAIMGRQIAPDEDIFAEASGGGPVDFDMGESGGESEGESDFGDIFGESAGAEEGTESAEAGPASEAPSGESESDEEAGLDFDIGDIGGEPEKTGESAEASTEESSSGESGEESGTLEPDFGESVDFDVSSGDSGTSEEPAAEESPTSGEAPESESKEDEGMDFDLGDFDLGTETGDTGKAETSGGEEGDQSTGTDSQSDFDRAFDELSQYVDTNTSESEGGESGTTGTESETGGSGEEDLDLGDLSFGETGTGDTGEDEEISFGEEEEGDEEGSDVGEIDTKLDLARAYIDMGDTDGAKSILEEVVEEGDDKQKGEARELLNNVS